MSGIFGLWNLNGGPVSRGAMDEMSRRLAHRGPDDSGTWIDGSLGLGHRMLRTTPESEHEKQPLQSPDGTLVVTADVRLDNREELMKALGIQGGAEAVPDAELVLASYRSWGERCVEHWIGDFALALWDAGTRRLFCARSPFGVKPFYYHHAPGRLFAFASEIEALLSLESVPDDIDEREVARHLLIPVGPDPSTTYYDKIRRLVPAHHLIVSGPGLETRRYWQLDPTRELRLSGDAEYAEVLRETFVEAVRCRLRCHTPVASMLSGGIDSASVTCVAADLLAREGERTLHSLSAVYPTVPESDEREGIAEVLDGREIVPHFFVADDTSPIAEFDQVSRLIGGAHCGSNLYLNWELYGLASKAGARVVLDGFDGDVVVSHGTGYLSELAIAGHWLRLFLASAPYSWRQERSIISDYRDLLRIARLHSGSSSVARRLARRLWSTRGSRSQGDGPGWKPASILNPEFASRFSKTIPPKPDQPTTEREFHLRMLNGSALPEIAGWLEACAAGRGLELRLPFFDVRLARLCLSFPPEQKIRRGWPRYAIRRAMEGILPPGIQWRARKTGLGPGWRKAWRSTQDGRIEDLLANPSPMIRSFLEPERVLDLHTRFLNDEAGREESRLLWRALSLALWLSSLEDPSRSGKRAPRESRPAAGRPRSS